MGSISGKYLECEVNGVETKGLHDWEADNAGGDVLDRTAGSDGGSTNTDVGCADLKATLRFHYDNETGLGVSLKFGTILTNVNLWANTADDLEPLFEMPEAIVISSPVTVPVRGGMEKTVTIKNRGPYVDNS